MKNKRKKHKIGIVLAWLAALACAVAIFCFSAQNGTDSAALSVGVMDPFARIMTFLFGEAGHNAFRKFAHFFAFGVLMFAVYHAFYRTRTHNRLSPVWPFVCCVLYAVSDEIHQYFVPERACRLFDVGVDTLGCLAGGLCFFLLAIWIEKRKERTFK